MQATADPLHDELTALVESLRSTGYHGSDASLPSQEAVVGTGIVALRQLEAVAVQLASVWLDGDTTDLAFAKTAFLPRMTALGKIAQEAIGRRPGERSQTLGVLLAVLELIHRAQAGADTELPAAVAPLLVGTMVLRQSLEHEALSNGPSGVFQAASSNVALSFFERCMQRLPEHPFGAAEGIPLNELTSRLTKYSHGTASISPAKARPQRRTA